MSDLTVPAPTDSAPEPTQELTQSRPQWLPEKFESPEALASAYTALESKMGSNKTDPTPSGTAAMADIMSTAENEARNGEVSAETYAALEASGMPRGIVDEMVAARKSTVDNFTNTLIDTAGGPEGWTKLQGWAATSLTGPEREEFNNSINSGDITRAKFAMEAMGARYAAATTGPRGQLVVPDGSAESHVGAYTSQAEVQNDMKDPRYKSDPAFREAVMARLAKSSI